MTSSGANGSSALFVTMHQPSSTATGARRVICQSIQATLLVVQSCDVGELDVAVQPDATAGVASAATSGDGIPPEPVDEIHAPPRGA